MTSHGVCPACGYDLHGHPDGQRCPECGASLRTAEPREIAFFQRVRVALFLLLIAGIGAIAAAAVLLPASTRLYVIPAILFVFVLAPIYIAAHLARRMDGSE